MVSPLRPRDVLHFDDINAAHEAMGFTGRTDLPNFHVYTLEETYPSTRQAMPPYTLRFYCTMLLEHADNAVLELNTTRPDVLDCTISFQSPGHVSSWVRGERQRGFLLYFQPEFLSHHPTPLVDEFPFFRATEINVLPLSDRRSETLRDHFARLCQTFGDDHPYRTSILQAQLLALLFDCKGLYEQHWLPQQASTRPALAARFVQMVEQHYLTRQSVQAYADLLHVTPNHLSGVVSSALGRTASDVIAARLLLAAQKFLRHSDLPITEISDALGFSEPTHFSRFFKRHAGQTPRQFRQHSAEFASLDANGFGKEAV